MEDKKILIVCSDLDFLLISKILQNGFFLDRATEVEEVLKKGETSPYNLLLADVSFLKSNLEILDRLRKMGCNIVGLSSEPADGRGRKMKDIGCKACYVKPFRLDTFSLFVEHWSN